MKFSLEKFENLAYTRQHEPAVRELLLLLSAFEVNHRDECTRMSERSLREVLLDVLDVQIWTRIASAVSCLFSDRDFALSDEDFGRIFHLNRWLSSIFHASVFGNADHVVRAFNVQGKGDRKTIAVSEADMLKFCLLYSSESEIALDIDDLWAQDKALAVGLCMVLLSTPFLLSPAAHIKRELLLPWLAQKLPELGDMGKLPKHVFHDVYLHSSFAEQADKHVVKGAINLLVCKWLAQEGIQSLWRAPSTGGFGQGKPTMLVVVESFNASRPAYRAHSRTLEAARALFHVVGMGYATNRVGREVFDEFIEIQGARVDDQLRQIRAVAEAVKAQVLYLPDAGTSELTMLLTNLRLAPVQAMALSHPASSHSSEMDYVVVEEDYVGDPQCFSEELIRLPKDAMPRRPTAIAALFYEANLRENPEVVHITVAAKIRRLSPTFLSACVRIATKAQASVHFHFLTGETSGLAYLHAQRIIGQLLGRSATVYQYRNYYNYMKVISGTDMFLNPFPFGSASSVLDTVTTGLVGVCKTGREVHEHRDQGMFERLGFPDWLVAKTVDDYVNAAVRLIDGHTDRNILRRQLAGPDKVQQFYEGRPEILGQVLMAALERSRFISALSTGSRTRSALNLVAQAC